VDTIRTSFMSGSDLHVLDMASMRLLAYEGLQAA
jgi:hypothetical protein